MNNVLAVTNTLMHIIYPFEYLIFTMTAPKWFKPHRNSLPSPQEGR